MNCEKFIEKDFSQTEIVQTESRNSTFLVIENCILDNNLYSNPDLSLAEIATKTKMSTKKVSQMLLENTNLSFPDYINSLRIEKAKQYLQSTEFSQYTNLAIGLECGFNSKSTFYRVFTKITGTTPSDFKLKNP